MKAQDTVGKLLLDLCFCIKSKERQRRLSEDVVEMSDVKRKKKKGKRKDKKGIKYIEFHSLYKQ